MRNQDNIIDWSSSDALLQVISNINQPLSSIIELSDGIENKKSEILLSHSNQIKKLLEEISVLVQNKVVNLNYKAEPDIFKIYEENNFVKSICAEKIEKERISKTDIDWLMNLEREVYESLCQNDLNLYELSYRLAVSERQLYRKTKDIIYLTPNKYIRILKLHKAKKMIESYIYNSVSQVAYEVGFNDVYYFTKIFTQQYNISPKQLLQSI